MFKRVIRDELKVPAEIGYLGDLRDHITKVGRKYGISENIINAFKLAIDEAGTNIIRHAYRDWEGFITMRIIIREREVTILLIDQGHTFDPNKVGDPDLRRYVDIGKKGGLGIFIIRRVIDSIEYRKTEEGNELRLTKQRDVVPIRTSFVPDLSLSMKSRFFIIASSVLSPLVLILFFYTYSRISKVILQEDLAAGQALARSLSAQALEYLEEEKTWELAAVSSRFHTNHGPLVQDALIVDANDVIQGSNQTDLLLTPFSMPSTAVKMAENMYRYNLSGGREVIDIIQPAVQKATDRVVGRVHLLLDKTVIDGAIAKKRIDTIWLYGLILVLGNAGIIFLIYLTMSPFKRLAAWVRELGQGGSPDEMEFDASDEVGEIALAFNEITEKFRKSQVDLAEQERLQKEMQVAQEIQHTLLPDSFPDIEGYEIASYYKAAKEVGGDYFDFVEVDNETLGIVVADVSGKGVPGSLIMTMIRTALRTEARGNKNAAEVLARVNDFVMSDMKKGMFVTIFYIILDSKNRMISYASAGHNPMILYRSSTQKSFYLNPRGFPIGINLPEKTLFRSSIESDQLRLKEGDVLYLYTDGITEAMNPQRDQFGEERLLETIREFGTYSVEDQVDKIQNRLEVFTEEFPQNDDITLVAIKEKMKAEDVLFNLRSGLLEMVKKGSSVKDACAHFGVSTSTYYKYKKRYDKKGKKGLEEAVARSDIEEKHISIEEKAKIYDIMSENPEFGPQRISQELNTEKYGNTEIDSKRIYEELVRSRLNTKELRQAFIERKERGSKPKPPGTPMLTLDGKIIMETKKTHTPLPEGPLAGESIQEMEFEPLPGVEMAEEAESISPDTSIEEEAQLTAETSETAEQGDAGTMEDLDELEGLAEPDMEEELSSLVDENTDYLEGIVPSTEEALPEEPSEETLDTSFMQDEIFDELVADSEDLITGKAEEEQGHGDSLDLDEVLAINESDSLIEEDGQVEQDISMSAALELIQQEIGEQEESGEGNIEEDTILKGSEEAARRHFESGLSHYKDGQFNEAIEDFLKIIETNPHDCEVYQYLGDAYFRLGELKRALNAYESARQLEPDNIVIRENLGVIFANMGEFKKAVWQWGEVLKLDPDRTDIIERIKKMQRVIRRRYQ